MAPSVSEWLERIGRGDGEARAWLYETFAGRLYRGLRARYAGRHGYDAEELLQDAFLLFFQHDARVLSRFLELVPESERTEARLERHLWDLACGVASNRRRSLRRRPESPLPERPLTSAGPGPERESLGRDTVQRLAQCIRARNERVYLYFKLRYVDGLTPVEIAEATGWSLKATYKLKLRLNEAVAACAARLGIR